MLSFDLQKQQTKTTTKTRKTRKQKALSLLMTNR
jgi:hypothetical protein